MLLYFVGMFRQATVAPKYKIHLGTRDKKFFIILQTFFLKGTTMVHYRPSFID